MNKVFLVEADASSYGIGAVWMQEGHLVQYINKVLSPKSRLLSAKSRLLSAYEKEMLAILFIVNKWEHYLKVQRFIIRTNHQSLKHLLEQRVTTPSQQVWVAKLLQFD